MSVALGDRTLFPQLKARAYLNHASISPPSLLVQEAVQAVITDYAQHGVDAVMGWIEQRSRLRADLADVIGARPEDIGFTANTSAGVTAVAVCFPWSPGDRIVLFQGEFPTNVTPWQQAARASGAQIDFLPLSGFGDGSGDGLARLDAHLRANPTRLVAVSAVQFQTGLRMPLSQMADLCHRHGAQIFVDAIQAVGCVPIDVRSLDYVACGSHKWMMGLEGAGFVYIHPDRIAGLRPRLASWLSHAEGGIDFLFLGGGHLRYDRPIRQRADFVESGMSNSVGLAALHAALGPLRTLGVDTIYRHVQRYHDALEPTLLSHGFRSERARDPAARSGTLSACPPAGIAVPALSQALSARGVATSTPDGRIRFAPHWPNALSEIPMVTAAIDAACAEIRS